MYNKNFRKAIGMIMAFAMIISFLPVSAYGSVTSDTTPPTLLSASRTSDTSITVTLSENCANLTKTGGGGFTVTQTSGTATYTVSATAQVIDLKHVALTVEDMSASCDSGVTVTYTKGTNGTIADTANNALETNATGVTVSPWDGAPPTLVNASRTSNAKIVVELSEDCQNLTQANDGGFTVKETGGTAAYTVTATAQGDDTGHVVLSVEDMSTSASKGVTVTYTKGTHGTIEDLAENALETNTSGVSIAPWDSDVPTVEITTTAPDPTYTRSIPLTITFSEAVTGFTSDDITVEYATKNDNFSGSGSVYRITLTPTGDGDTITVNVAAGAAKDSAGNNNAAATRFSIVYASTVDYLVDGGSITFAPQLGTIVGFKGSPTTVVIPDKIGGVSVTRLGQNSLSNCTSMTSVVLPASITQIDQGVFSGCTGLKSITIPDSVTVINQSTFLDCTNLREVIFPSGLTSVRDQSFNGCRSLETITFPDSLELIGWGAYLNCTGLKSITIPASVTSIEGSAFKNCGSLAAVYMKGNPPTYGTDVFQSTAAGITVYYRSGATGFSDTYAGCPTALWGQHPVTVNCGAGGTVSPENPSVYAGETVSFTIIPDAGFQISTLTYNGKNVTADSDGKYLSPAVLADAELNVTFEAAGTPTVTISTEADGPYNTSPIPVTITFSEDVTGFDVSDIGVTGGTAGNFNKTSAMVYTADITPTGGGTVTVRVVANAAQNAASIGNRAAELSVTYDATAPSLSSASADQINGSGASLKFTSDEAGTYYYLVYPAAYTPPVANAIKAQGDGAAAKGTGAAISGANSANVTGLSATTDYKAYVVVEDAARNLSAVKTIAFSTTIEKIPLTDKVTSFESGKTYTIADTHQLWCLSNLVRGDNPGTEATFELLNDIAFGYWQDTDGDGVVDDGEIFDEPSGGEAYTKTNYSTIGYGGYHFSGTFDGNGHTISGLYFNEYAANVGTEGLFTTVDGGTVKNLRIANSYIRTYKYTGSIAGVLTNGGMVENCVVDSSVTITGNKIIGGIVGSCSVSTIQHCYNYGNIIGSDSAECVGGIVGYLNNTDNTNDKTSLVQCCYNTGNVSGTNYIGGIVGDLNSIVTYSNTLRNCYNTGSVSASAYAGGIAGRNYGVLQNCYNTGSVSGETSSSGGIAGQLRTTFANKLPTGGAITGCYYDSTLCSVGGIAGADASGSAEGYTTTQMTSNTAFSGWDTAIWTFMSGNYPRLTALISTDETAPTLVSAEILNRTSVKVTLSEDCRLLTKANDGGFTVTAKDGMATYAVTATAQGDNPREVVLTVADLLASGSKGVRVTYTKGTNGTIADPAGNALESDGNGVAAGPWETTAPTMLSAVYVNNTQITVTLSEDCLNLNHSNDGGFTVKETGVTTTYAVTSTVMKSSNKITLYVSDMSPSGGKGVTVTYTKGGNGNITDLMGNELETNGIGVVVSAWDTGKPEVSGVSNGASYNTDVAPTFAEGAATLAKDGGAAASYISGATISVEGSYVLTVTNAAGSTVISFTIDKTAPVLSGTSLVLATSAGAALSFSSDEAVPYYCLVLPSGDPAPDADAFGAAGPGAGRSGAASAGTNNVDVSGLIAGTNYIAYLILQDAAGNRSAMGTVTLTTADVVIPLDASVTTLQSGVTYTIDSTDQFNRLGFLVQSGQSGAGATFVLTEDIVFGYWQDTNTNNIVDNGEIFNAESGGAAFKNLNYTVIGKNLKYFSGTFDGRGHTVSGLYTSGNNTAGNLALSALIGGVDGGIVRNVGVKNSYIQGYKYPAGVVGYLKSGTVENCYTDSSVSIVGGGIGIGGVVGRCESSTIAFCYNKGSVRSEEKSTHLGGIAGEVSGTGSFVRSCYNTGAVYTAYSSNGTGGIAGVLSNESGIRLENCYNSGSVTGSGDMYGGIVGFSLGSILNCYNVGEVGGTSYRGNIVGSRSYLDSCVTTGCYYDSNVCTAVGGIEGSNPAGSAEGKTTAEMKTDKAFTGWGGNIWNFESGKYPQLIGFAAFTDRTAPTITDAVRNSDTEITITLSEDCRYLTRANNGGFTVTEKDGTKTYAVTATAKGTDSKHIVLTLSSIAASGAKGVTVTYTKGKNGTIADMAYNTLKTDGTGITIAAWDTTGPEVNDVSDGTIYRAAVTPTFTEGTATLKKDDEMAKPHTSDTEITEDGSYVLTVTDAVGNKTVIHFTIDTTKPEVSGIIDGMAYNTDVTPTFADATATLKKGSGTATEYNSGTAITEEGSYVLIATDKAGNVTTVNFTIDKTAPVLSDTATGVVTGTGAQLNFASDEAGTYYFIILPAGDPAPNAGAVRAQGYGPESLGSGEALAAPNTANATGLIAGTNYKAYVIVEDAAGNRSAVATISLTTTDGTIPLTSSVTTLEGGKTYTIADAEQMNNLAELVDAGQTGVDSTFVLTSDIRYGYWQDKDIDGVVDYGEIYNSESGGDAYASTNYEVIGYMDIVDEYTYIPYSFSGTFDGRGHTVSGMYNNTADPYAFYSTLFACVDGGTIRNVGVKESYIQGGISVSALVGDCVRGTVENCWTDKSVSVVGMGSTIGGIVGYCDSSVIRYCYNNGSVSGTGEASNIGGIVGMICGESAVLSCCYNTGSVTGEDGSYGTLSIGGIAGSVSDNDTESNPVSTNNNIVRNCYNTGFVSGNGNFVGGIVGDNSGDVVNCYNAGRVRGGTDLYGGVLGYFTADYCGLVTGCYYDNKVCMAAGINGSDIVGSAEGKNTDWMKEGAVFTDWNADVWCFESGKYPELVGALVFDNTPPTVEIKTAATDPTNSSPFTVTITFSKNVTGFAADDVIVENGTEGTLSGSGKVYTINITPTKDGEVTVDIASGVATDSAGNGNTAAEQLSLTYDATAPTAPTVKSASTSTNDSTPEWTWTAGTGGNGVFRYKLDDSDLATGATETTEVSYTPASGLSDSDHTLYVQERDAAGNWSASGSFAVMVDSTVPTAGGAGAISPSGISWNSVTLSWSAASDTDTAQEKLQYKVVRSQSNNIATLTDANANGTLVKDWTANLTSMAATGLTGPKNYYFNVIVKDAAGNETVYSSVFVTTAAPPNDDDSDTPNPAVTVYVNGEEQSAGALTTTTTDGQTVSTVTVNDKKLEQLLEGKGDNAVVTIPINTGSDVAKGVLNGQTVKNMEDKEAVLVVQTDSSTYTLPASEIDIDAISEQFGEDVTLSDIKVTVSISEPSDKMTTIIENAAEDGGFTIAVPAVAYTITCKYGGRTVEVDSFSAYVERMIAIPDGVDPSKITTGIVVDPDGTVHHVPTKITVIDGKYYAVINSLTNSAYSIIWNPVEFTDVESHWAKDAINNMGSRMVVTGTGDGNYNPDRDITRAEFATIMVRALGLEPGMGVSGFNDVSESDWYCGYVKTASEYGLITGYPDGTFGPNNKITREQAMAIVARAMKITKLETSLTAKDISAVLAEYLDAATVSSYADESIAVCISAGIVSGRLGNTIAPKDNITRAEVAVIVERLLQKSELI